MCICMCMCLCICMCICMEDFPSGSVVKNPLAMNEMKETQVQSLSQEDLLEEIATHFVILARKIPWTEKPGGL